jgi:membrane protease YdiL (CAAX protease family)
MTNLRNLFYSKQGKLFSIWRYLRLIVISFLATLFGSKLFNVLNIPFSIYPNKLIAIASIILVTIFIDKEKIDSLGIELKIKSFILIVIGIIWAYFCFVQIEVIGIFTSKSGFQLENPFSSHAISLLGYYLFFISLPEELLYRSYLISNVKRDFNSIVAIFISFIIFSGVHFVSGAWTNVSQLAFGFMFTLLCGLTFVLTKNIFIAVGFHGAYNTYNDLFNSGGTGMTIILIVLLINTLIFYLIYKKTANFNSKSLIIWTRHLP